MTAQAENILQQALAWRSAGRGVALATVIETWGSSPRPVGSQLAINDRGAFVGSVSGGCIESIVVSEAIDVIAEGEPQDLEYGVSDAQAHEVRLSCGGRIRVYVERAPEISGLERMIRDQPNARVIDLESGNAALVGEDSVTGELALTDDELTDVRRRLDRDSSGLVQYGNADCFVSIHAPPRKLIIIGAVHIAQALAPMAAAAGFCVSVIDPRPRFATAERLPDVSIVTTPVDKAMADIAIDRRSALVALGHDPLLDDPALMAALESSAYYIGCLGSRKTHAERLQRLRANGFDDAQLARLHGPIGLDIGGRSPGDIAVSILAEIIAVGNDKRTS